MLKTIKALFEDQVARYAAGDDPEHALPLAVTALLLEISRADHDVDPREREAIAASVAEVCSVDADELDALVASADEAVDDAVSLYDFTSVVNEHLAHDKKYELLCLLWRVAYADGRIDRYEDYYVRKIADLLHLSQREFIRAKHAAAPADS